MYFIATDENLKKIGTVYWMLPAVKERINLQYKIELAIISPNCSQCLLLVWKGIGEWQVVDLTK